jgi:hypothetical protein
MPQQRNAAVLSRLPTRDWVLAYLGDQAARAHWGPKAPPAFTLASMKHGGDRNWRTTCRILSHACVSAMAREVLRLSWEIYQEHPDPNAEIQELARQAVHSALDWNGASTTLVQSLLLEERCARFFLAVDVGGSHFQITSSQAYWLGRLVGDVFSVILGAQSRRYVRSLGDAVEVAMEHFCVPEAAIYSEIAELGRAELRT